MLDLRRQFNSIVLRKLIVPRVLTFKGDAIMAAKKKAKKKKTKKKKTKSTGDYSGHRKKRY